MLMLISVQDVVIVPLLVDSKIELSVNLIKGWENEAQPTCRSLKQYH